MTAHRIPQLDRRGLQRFGLVTGAMVAGVFGLLLPWIFGQARPVWPLVVGALLWTAALAAPLSLNPVHAAWMRFGLLASRVTTPVILGAFFFVIISPVALVRRLCGRDSMSRRFERDLESYRVASRPQTKDKLEKPF